MFRSCPTHNFASQLMSNTVTVSFAYAPSHGDINMIQSQLSGVRVIRQSFFHRCASNTVLASEELMFTDQDSVCDIQLPSELKKLKFVKSTIDQASANYIACSCTRLEELILDTCKVKSQTDFALQKISVKKVKISGNMEGQVPLLKLVLDTRSIEQLVLDDCQLYQQDLEELVQL